MLNVIVIGLGPIGISAARAVQADREMKLVGLVDLDPKKVGKTLDQIDQRPMRGRSRAPKITSDLRSTLAAKPAVAIVTTTSYFDQIVPTLRECIKHRIHVVSSCEEMSFPVFRHKRLAERIDAEAKRRKVALLGTGVNPGFVMDLLPLVLSSMTTGVSSVKVTRRLDASKRRKPLQAKVGATMTPEQFRDLARQGKIGHMGIGESVAMIAAGLGRQASPSDVEIGLHPVIADRQMKSELGTIHPGMVCGMRNTAKWNQDGLSIELDLTMAVGAANPMDRIDLDGPVPLSLIIPGSTPGDSATVAALKNCARLMPRAVPGLKTMLDMPVASAR